MDVTIELSGVGQDDWFEQLTAQLRQHPELADVHVSQVQGLPGTLGASHRRAVQARFTVMGAVALASQLAGIISLIVNLSGAVAPNKGINVIIDHDATPIVMQVDRDRIASPEFNKVLSQGVSRLPQGAVRIRIEPQTSH